MFIELYAPVEVRLGQRTKRFSVELKLFREQKSLNRPSRIKSAYYLDVRKMARFFRILSWPERDSELVNISDVAMGLRELSVCLQSSAYQFPDDKVKQQQRAHSTKPPVYTLP